MISGAFTVPIQKQQCEHVGRSSNKVLRRMPRLIQKPFEKQAKEEGGRRNEEGGRRKEGGGSRKEEGGKRKC